jgi:cytochrome c oxidase subunit 3
MAGDVKHDYHLVKPSPWPLLASLAMLVMVLGGAGYMKGLWFIPQGAWWGPLPGLVALIFVLIGWWGDVLKESRQGDHKEVVQISLRYGMVLFIASEVMFFVAWFWEFFEMAIYHTLRANPEHSDLANPALEPLLKWSEWPVAQINGAAVRPFDPFHLPLINTLILLLSGTTVTWAHHALQSGDRKGRRSACCSPSSSGWRSPRFRSSSIRKLASRTTVRSTVRPSSWPRASTARTS